MIIMIINRGMQSIVGRAELAIAVQPPRWAVELSGLLYITRDLKRSHTPPI